MTVNKQGWLNGYGKLWYDDRAMTNILSLNNMKKKFRVSFDSKNGDKFIVHKPEKEVWFKNSSNGLYYHDTRNRQISMVNTVKENTLGMTKREIEGAKKAKDLYMIMGYPSLEDFKNMIRQNMIMNCPITVADVENSIKIFGQDIHMF